jgi:hypothetical protein
MPGKKRYQQLGIEPNAAARIPILLAGIERAAVAVVWQKTLPTGTIHLATQLKVSERLVERFSGNAASRPTKSTFVTGSKANFLARVE